MTSDTAETKALVRRYLRAFNDRDWELLAELLADDAVEHGVHEELRGPEAIIEFLEGHHEAFPDYAGTTEAMLAEDDLVAVRYTATGTHTGEYRDVEPTGHAASWTGIAIYRVEDDQIAEVWLEEDRLGLLEQLELVTGQPPAHLRL